MDGLTSKFNTVRDTRINEGISAQPLEKKQFQGNFNKVFEDALHKQEPVQFSKHAHMRLNDRKISLTGDQLSRVEAGLSKANAKGIRDSLVLVDDVALVVNVKSKTVITAMSAGNSTVQGQDNVFSNIDGAVIV